MDKEYRKYIKELMRKGWTCEIGRKAVKLRSPGGRLVSCSISPSCPYALKHLQADVKRVERTEK